MGLYEPYTVCTGHQAPRVPLKVFATVKRSSLGSGPAH
jgi:hypothetical protein